VLPKNKQTKNMDEKEKGWDWNSVTECLPSMCPTVSNAKTKTEQKPKDNVFNIFKNNLYYIQPRELPD
jgi:hypothetical protein